MLVELEGAAPRLGAEVFVAPGAAVIGRVELGEASSVWFGAVVRGDVGRITVGARTNVQDVSVIHVSSGTFDTAVGSDVTIGHRVILHGCTIADHVLVGMGAVVMDDVEVGPYCFIGAGALLTPGKRIPAGSLVLGSPARVVRPVTDGERRQIDDSARHYAELARRYRAGALYREAPGPSGV